MPWSGCEPIGGPTFELLGLNGSWERFQLCIPSYLWWLLAHRGSELLFGAPFEERLGVIKESVAPPAQKLSVKIEDEVIPPRG